MRHRRLVVFCLALGCSALPSCGKPTAPSDARSAATPEAGARVAGPRETVAQYLEAVRTGDAATVNDLLTALAQQKTTELNIAVAPAGSDTASFEVGAMKYVTEAKDEAHVASRWSDVNETQQTQTVDVTWILRSEPVGWRVAGMMGQFVEGQPLMVFNFENPQEVIRQQLYAQEQMQRRVADERQVQAVSGDTLRR